MTDIGLLTVFISWFFVTNMYFNYEGLLYFRLSKLYCRRYSS